jgi:NitT/TauT family transport system substrate-binding protein
VLWGALYGSDSAPGSVKLELDFIINDRVKTLLNDATAFLYSLPNKPAAAAAIRDGGVDDSIARKVLEKRGLKSPLGLIKAQPMSAYKE